jgi:hypothetical protein
MWLVQHPFCKFCGCWFCAAVLAGAMRARSARSAEDGTAARRNTDRPFPQAISSGHSYPITQEGIDSMAQRVEHHPLDAAFAALLNNGLDGAGEALRILVNEASRIERNHFLNAQPHERTAERTDYANGFKPKNDDDPRRRTDL